MDPYAALKNSSGFGAKMMASMGWSVGKGLGKDESGRVNIVTVTKREDGVGLGVGVADTADDAIKERKHTFAAISSKIQVPSDSDSDSGSDSDSSDEDESKVSQLIEAQAGNCATDEEIALLKACSGRGAGGGQGGHGGAMARLGKLRRVQAQEGRGEGGSAAAIAMGEIQRDENGVIIVPERPKVVHERRKSKKKAKAKAKKSGKDKSSKKGTRKDKDGKPKKKKKDKDKETPKKAKEKKRKAVSDASEEKKKTKNAKKETS